MNGIRAKRLAEQKLAEFERRMALPYPGAYKRKPIADAPDVGQGTAQLYDICPLEIDKAKERNALRLNRLPNPAKAIELNQTAYLATLRPPSKLSKYGLSVNDYFAMVQQQHGRCAICNAIPENRQLDVDHCHSTGKVRGLLCSPCNTALGSFKDRPDILRKAADYLEKSRMDGSASPVEVVCANG